MTPLLNRLPESWKRLLRRGRGVAKRSIGRPEWGTLRRRAPFSDSYGLDRGTSVDRPYIDAFIAHHAEDIRGTVLELLDSRYTDQFGKDRVHDSQILDINPDNRQATIVADLGEPNSLPAETFDCFVLTQTLHFVADLEAGLMNAWTTIKSGGSILISMPVVSRLDPTMGHERDFWRLTPAGLGYILKRTLPDADIHVEGHGNLVTSVAFLYGLAAEELSEADYRLDDPHFPLVACARVVKPR